MQALARDNMPRMTFTLILSALMILTVLFQPSGPSAPTPTSQPVSPAMRVTCFNLRLNVPFDGANAWPFRKAMVVDHLRRMDSDVVGTQEMLEGMRADLAEALPGYTFVGVARDDGKTKGEYCGLFIKSARFDVVRSGTFWLSQTPDVVGSVGWDAALTRICTWAVVCDRLNANAEVALFNAHFDHRGEQARTESARLLLSKVNEMALPAIVMGDLNSIESTAAVKTLVAGEDALVDTYRSLHPVVQPDEATFHGFSGKPAGDRIDYIFVRGFATASASIDRFHLEGRYPSDHFPIHATVRVSH
jgi:endonuclease/exonuclease/phosphatase family metal-dependent hydrolase